MKKIILSLCSVLLASACAPSFQPAVNEIAKSTVDSLSCDDFESSVWDGVKTYLLEQNEIPSAFAISLAINSQLEDLKLSHPQITQDQVNTLALDLDSLFQAILEESPSSGGADTAQQLLLLISAIDVGDRTTTFKSYMVDKTKNLFAKVKIDIQNLGLNCPKSQSQAQEVTFARQQLEALQAGQPLAVFGQRWAFATAHQSCNALRLPAMTSATQDVQGIKIVGTHPDGVGSKRAISSLSEVVSTHNYIKDERSYGASCFDLRKSPLIYDYGGKPYATTSSTSNIDFFKDNGGGTSVLGIDCSGYVFTAMAAAGLKLKVGRALKASDSWAWGSSSYVEPQKNGLTCLDKIKVEANQSVLPGDIVAVYGHVFMVEATGADPFGILKTKSVSDCTRLSSKNFDFVVSQSSNSKNGIGLNRYQASDFVTEKGSTIQAGLEKYATYACQAFYNKKSYTPSIGTLSIVRHKGTKDCMATRVKLNKEECVASCDMISN